MTNLMLSLSTIVYFDGKVFFHSHKDGTKMGNIAKNPRVCFEVDSGEIVKGRSLVIMLGNIMSVIVRGKANVISDPERRLLVLKRLSDKYAPGKGKMLTAEDLEKNPQLVLVEINVDEMTGKKSPVKPPTS